MKRIAFFAVLPAVLTFITPSLGADDAAKVFDQIYGPKVKAAITSLDKADDHALVAELTRLASDSATDEALAIVMFKESYELAMRDPSGARLAAEAMAALAARVEAQRDFATEKRIDALNLAMVRGKADEREDAGAAMVDLLLEQGDAQAAEGKYTEATATYRRALVATGRIKSRSADDIKPRMETMLQQARAARQVELYRAKLLEDRGDTAAAEALVKVYLTELDNPAAAAAYLEIVKDEALKNVATLAAKPVGELNEADAMTLAEWYYAQSRGAKELAEAVTLGRAKVYLERFLALHEANDLAQSKAIAMKKEIETRGPSPRIVSKKTLPTRDLLRESFIALSFEKDTVSGEGESRQATDVSGGVKATLVGAMSCKGVAGDGLQLDGEDDSILVAPIYNPLTDNVRQFSMVLWVKVDSKGDQQILFDVGRYRDYSISLDRGDDWNFNLIKAKGGATVSAPTKGDSRWRHIACTWDGKELCFYFDGKVVDRAKTQLTAITKGGLLIDEARSGLPGTGGMDVPRIGGQAKEVNRKGRFFGGCIDEFALFKRALAEKEVQEIYQAGKAGIHFGQYK